ncbi:MAG: 2-oxo acid dehydrogenase subunit E2 [Caldilineaceae bacterium]|nr:2-oxo acid dehydrogenase subunit E2 [Caldilineaceae bacterium]
MPIAVIMPKFEMTQETGTVGAWLKAEGDFVRKGEPILEIETDKVSMEVEAPADGTLVAIAAGPRDVVPVGQPIAYLVRVGEAWPAPASEPAPPAPASEPMPSPAALPGREDKADAPPPHTVVASPVAARMAAELRVDLSAVTGTGLNGQVTRKDIDSYLNGTGGAPVPPTEAAAPPMVGNGFSHEDAAHVRAVPAARRLARELGVDLRQVRGAGPDGRIQSTDVRAFAARTAAAAPSAPLDVLPAPTPATPSLAGPQQAPVPAGSPAVRRMIPLTNVRRTIAERMAASVREAPQFTVSVDADMTRALAVVEDLKAGAATDKPRVTLTALLIRVCAWALTEHPDANSAFADGQIAEWDEVNIGVATALDAGLIVPVVRGADRLGLRAIAGQLADLATRARAGRLKLDDLQGGAFTLSNLGMFGVDRFTAILNPPQAAILAVGRIAKRAVVVDDDQVAVRPVATLTLTADHRVLDGAAAARFLATIQRALEHPGAMLA